MEDRRDNGPKRTDAGVGVELTALRRFPQERARVLRDAVPAALGRILREVPEAELALEMGADEFGIVGIRIAVVGVDGSAELVDAVADALRGIAETTTSSGDLLPECVVRPLVPEHRDARLGFVVASTGSGGGRDTWRPDRKTDLEAFLRELSSLPGTGLTARLRVADDGFLVSHGILSSTTPGIRVRAMARRHFPGLVVGHAGDAGAAEPTWLGIDPDDLSSAFPIPVGGPDPMPGCYTAPASPIPVTPVRGTETLGAVRIGSAVTAAGTAATVQLSAHERVRHLHVVGRTGTGKSSAIAGLVHHTATSGEGLILLDPHGTLVDRVIAEMPAECADRVWLIRCGDVDNAVPISPLAESDPVRRDIAIDATCAIFQELFDKKETGIVGPRFRERVAMGLRALTALYGDTASVLDVPVILGDDSAMIEALKRTTDARLIAFWKNDKTARRSSDHGELVSWVNSKFEGFSGTAPVRAILGSGRNAVDFADAMDSDRIILVDLSKAGIGETAARLLGYLYLDRVWAGALLRSRRERPFSVIVDEAHSLISGSLSTMLAEGRKFGLSVTLAHQYIDQLDQDLRPAVDGNVGTTIAFRSAVSDLPALTTRFGGMVEPSTLTTLPDLSAIVMRSAIAAAVPHTLVIDHNERIEPRAGRELRTFEQMVSARSHALLVDPYRAETAAAALGKSRVGEASAGTATPSRQTGDGSSFLDEWLAKRKAADGTAAGANDAGCGGVVGFEDELPDRTQPSEEEALGA